MTRASLRAVRLSTLAVALVVAAVAAQDRPARTLDVYVIAVEGGNATLFVSPSRESLLIDTGNGGPAATRDADRIMAAVKDASLMQIDHLITTHYHGKPVTAAVPGAGRPVLVHAIQPRVAVDLRPPGRFIHRHQCAKRIREDVCGQIDCSA